MNSKQIESILSTELFVWWMAESRRYKNFHSGLESTKQHGDMLVLDYRLSVEDIEWKERNLSATLPFFTTFEIIVHDHCRGI